MPNRSAGRSLVTRRAVADVVRAAALGSYGVTGFAANPVARLAGRLGLGQPGVRIELTPRLAIELRLTVAYGVPVAEVARQVESAVRYAVRRSLERDVDTLRIHVGGLEYEPGGPPPSVPNDGAGATSDASVLVAASPAVGDATRER